MIAVLRVVGVRLCGLPGFLEAKVNNLCCHWRLRTPGEVLERARSDWTACLPSSEGGESHQRLSRMAPCSFGSRLPTILRKAKTILGDAGFREFDASAEARQARSRYRNQLPVQRLDTPLTNLTLVSLARLNALRSPSKPLRCRRQLSKERPNRWGTRPLMPRAAARFIRSPEGSFSGLVWGTSHTHLIPISPLILTLIGPIPQSQGVPFFAWAFKFGSPRRLTESRQRAASVGWPSIEIILNALKILSRGER